MQRFHHWRERDRRLKDEATALSVAVRDPRTAWPAMIGVAVRRSFSVRGHFAVPYHPRLR